MSNHTHRGDKIAAYVFGVVFLVVLLGVVITVPRPTDPQWFVFRVILALAAAGIGAVVPGFISVTVSSYVRAGGAIALFVLIYWFNPPLLVNNSSTKPGESLVAPSSTPTGNAKPSEAGSSLTNNRAGATNQTPTQAVANPVTTTGNDSAANPVAGDAASTVATQENRALTNDISNFTADVDTDGIIANCNFDYTYSGDRGNDGIAISICASQDQQQICSLSSKQNPVTQGHGHTNVNAALFSGGVMLATKLDSHRPILYEVCFLNERVGAHGTPFDCRRFTR